MVHWASKTCIYLMPSLSEVHTVGGRNLLVFTGNTKKHQNPDLKSWPCHISSSCLKCSVRLILLVEDKSILISCQYLSRS